MVNSATSEEQQIFSGERASIAYFDLASVGAERGTVLLVHGFASTAQVNWIGTSWSQTLRQAGYRVIALDNRGHGASQKFYDPADYGPDIFAADALALLDYLGVERCYLMGYSMGARISCWLAHQAPQRFPAVVFGGMGEHIYGGRGGYAEIAEALEADDPDASDNPAAKGFRIFADRVGADRLALAACIRPSAQQLTPEIVAGLTVPVLVAVGDEDGIGGSATVLADQIPSGEAFVIEGKDHMKAVGDLSYKKRVVAFFEAHS